MHLNSQKKSYRISAGLLVLLIILIKSILLLISIYSYRPIIITFSVMAIAPALFLFAFSFLFNASSKLVYLFILDVIVSLVFVTDAVYFRAFDHIISVYMIFAKGVTEDLGSSILSLIQLRDFLFLMDLPVIYFLFFRSCHFTEEDKVFKVRFVQSLYILVLSISLICYQFINQVEQTSLCNPAIRPLTMSPLGAHMFDIYRFIYERNDRLDTDDIAKIEKWLGNNEKYQTFDIEYESLRGVLAGKNLIVIQFESLENILIGSSFYGYEITPNINSLLKNSIYFNNIYEQTRDGNSSDAELLFNTSLYPLGSGSAFLRFGDNEYPGSLPRQLKKLGYTTIAIHGDNKEFWNRDRTFSSFGFDKYISEEEFENQTKVGMGILDKYLFDESYKEIERLNTPYYFFIITVTSHMPFNAADRIDSTVIPEDDLTAKYLKCINYTDREFGNFYHQLKDLGILNNSVLIIYGDHEGVHKYYPTTLPDNGKKIPFIVHVPEMQGKVIDTVGGQVDMMPTLAYLLGIDETKYSRMVMGRNLFSNNPGAAILSDGSIVGNKEDGSHLARALETSDLVMRGNYFAREYSNMLGQN